MSRGKDYINPEFDVKHLVFNYNMTTDFADYTDFVSAKSEKSVVAEQNFNFHFSI